jgi:hypothetical protein
MVLICGSKSCMVWVSKAQSGGTVASNKASPEIQTFSKVICELRIEMPWTVVQ